MSNKAKYRGLAHLGSFLKDFLNKTPEQYNSEDAQWASLLEKATRENPWFTPESLDFTMQQWSKLLATDNLEQWLSHYRFPEKSKNIGLILAGNLPLVGFHDIICTLLCGHKAIVKMSSKDKSLLPFLLNYWQKNTAEPLAYQWADKLEGFDAVIATGSNNTARYLNYYFKDYPNIIRKNRTSVAVLTGEETDEDLANLAKDIFIYFGLGCRNITHLYLPKGFDLERLFSNFIEFKEIINHHKYANNYDYNRAIYLLNKEKFWDNNFILLRETDDLFSPLAVVNFSYYENLAEVQAQLVTNEKDIQCVAALPGVIARSVALGTTQCPDLSTYADHVDTMEFLCTL